MQDIGEISDAYSLIEASLAESERNARSNDESFRAQIARYVNDSAYFILVFAQFEDAARLAAEALIAARRAQSSWVDSSPWDVVNAERLPFMEIVSLLVERGKHDYNLIRDLFQLRNEVAHGELLVRPILIPALISTLKGVAGRFRKP